VFETRSRMTDRLLTPTARPSPWSRGSGILPRNTRECIRRFPLFFRSVAVVQQTGNIAGLSSLATTRSEPRRYNSFKHGSNSRSLMRYVKQVSLIALCASIATTARAQQALPTIEVGGAPLRSTAAACSDDALGLKRQWRRRRHDACLRRVTLFQRRPTITAMSCRTRALTSRQLFARRPESSSMTGGFPLGSDFRLCRLPSPARRKACGHQNAFASTRPGRQRLLGHDPSAPSIASRRHRQSVHLRHRRPSR
jgi:hypothetical protein